MTATSFLTGYNGTVRSRSELMSWSQWVNLDPEQQRRVLAILDDSATAGTPLGIGEIFRSFEVQEMGALARHHEVSVGAPHCCTYKGKYYQLNPNTAHMAFTGLSYHEATTRAKKALAIDFTGHLPFLTANAAKYGLVEFSKVNSEPWHGQPIEIPHSRSKYSLSMDPLAAFKLPGSPTPAPLKVWAPNAAMIVGAVTATVDDVRSFQLKCNFWGWHDRMNKTLLVDGDYGAKSAEACISMQRSLGIIVDGRYGNQTKAALQGFLDYMASLAVK